MAAPDLALPQVPTGTQIRQFGFAPSGSIRVIAYPSPFREEHQDHVLDHGMTAREICTSLEIDPETAFVMVDDWVYERGSDELDKVPHNQSLVVVRGYPSGAFALPAVIIGTGLTLVGQATGNRWLTLAGGIFLLGGSVGGLMAGTINPGAAMGGFAIGAQSTLSSIAGPQQRNPTRGPGEPTISASSNSLPLFEPLPRVFGERRVYPDYGALPYTKVIGGKTYLWALFLVSYGPCEILEEDMRIGEDPLSTFTGVDVQIIEGDEPDQTLTNFPGTPVPRALNDTLWSHVERTKGSFVRKTLPNSTNVAFTFSSPGHWTQGRENVLNAESLMTVRVRRKDGSNNWIIPTGGPSHLFPSQPQGSVTVTDHSHAQYFRHHQFAGLPWVLRVTGDDAIPFNFGMEIDFEHPELEGPGEYDIEIIMVRTSGEVNSDSNSELTLATITSFIPGDPWPMPGFAKVALRIRASEQLNGPLENFNLLAKAKLPIWNGSSWSAPQLTRSPVWAYMEMLRGSVAAYPVADEYLDLDRMLLWDSLSTTHGWRFDGVIKTTSQLWDVLGDIASTAQASPTVREGKYSVSIDYDKSAEPRANLFTPRNTKRFSFTGQKTFHDLPHALRMRFESRDNNYVATELTVYRDGFNEGNATIFETMDVWGITEPDRVYQYGRYHFANLIHRPEIYTIEVDPEHMVCERSDWVKLAHDVPMFGKSFARVSSITTEGGGDISRVGVDEELTYHELDADTNPISYAVTIRKADGTISAYPVRNLAESGGVMVKASHFEPVPHIPGAEAPAVPDMVTFGIAGSQERDCIVLSIQPKPDHSAVISMADAGEAIFGDLSQPIPPYDPGLPVGARIPPVGVRIIRVQDLPSAVRLSIVPNAKEDGTHEVPAQYIEAQWKLSTATEWSGIPVMSAATTELLEFSPAVSGATYDFRVRTIVGATTLTFSDWEELNGYRYQDPSFDVFEFEITGLRVAGGLGENTFATKDVTADWRINAPNFIRDGLGDAPISRSPSQGVTASVDAYSVRISDATTSKILRTEVVSDRFYTYTYAKNVEDGGPYRSLLIAVAPVIAGLVGRYAQITATNPAPPLPLFISSTPGLGSFQLSLELSGADGDVGGVIVWADSTTGFEPGKAREIFRGSAGKLTLQAPPGATAYYRYAAFDEFDSAPSNLNVSKELTVDVSGVDVPDGSITPDKVRAWLVGLSGVGPPSGAPVAGIAPYYYQTDTDTFWKWNGISWEVTVPDTQKMFDDTIFDQYVVNLNAVKLHAGTIAADRIGAKTISVEKLVVRAFDNYASDPNFDSIANGDVAVRPEDAPGNALELLYTVEGVNAAADVINAADDANLTAAYAGEGVLRFVDKGDAGCAVYVGADKNTAIAAAPGEVFTFRARVTNVNGGNNFYIARMQFYDAFRAVIHTETGPLSRPADNVWEEVTVDRFAAPAGTAFMSAAVVMGADGTEPGYADAYELRRAAGTAFIEKLAVTDAEIGELNVDKVNAGSMSGTHITARTLEGDSLNFKTVKAENFVLQSGNNLIQDPGFEQLPIAEWGNFNNGGATGWAIVTDSAESLSGERYLEYNPAGQTTSGSAVANGPTLGQEAGNPSVGGGDYQEPTSQIITDKHYYFEYWHKLKTGSTDPGDVNQHRGLVRFVTSWSPYTFVDLGDAFTARSTTDWQREFHVGKLPEGALAVQFWIQVDTAVADSGAIFNFDDLHARLASQTHELEPESSTSVSTHVNDYRIFFPPHFAGSQFILHFEGEYDPNVVGSFGGRTREYLQVWVDGQFLRSWLYPLGVGKHKFNHTIEISDPAWDGRQSVGIAIHGDNVPGTAQDNGWVNFSDASVTEYKR